MKYTVFQNNVPLPLPGSAEAQLHKSFEVIGGSWGERGHPLEKKSIEYFRKKTIDFVL